MRCDVRPVLSDGENQLLDPYATPNSCRCHGDRQIQDPCRDHGCCSLSVRMYECPARCRSSIIYHTYTQHQSHRRVRFHSDEHHRRWRDLPVFDGSIFPIASQQASPESRPNTCASESVEFRLARDQILDTGRLLDEILLEINDSQTDAQRLERWHDRDHGPRCGGRQQHCTAMERIRNAKEHLEDLELALEAYRQLWRRWKVYLRGLERRGDRRLSGLEEWRRRQGRGADKEEHDRLMGFYRYEIRADEKRRGKRRFSRTEGDKTAKKASWFESQDDYSGDESSRGGSRARRRTTSESNCRTFADNLRTH